MFVTQCNADPLKLFISVILISTPLVTDRDPPLQSLPDQSFNPNHKMHIVNVPSTPIQYKTLPERRGAIEVHQNY